MNPMQLQENIFLQVKNGREIYLNLITFLMLLIPFTQNLKREKFQKNQIMHFGLNLMYQK